MFISFGQGTRTHESFSIWAAIPAYMASTHLGIFNAYRTIDGFVVSLTIATIAFLATLDLVVVGCVLTAGVEVETNLKLQVELVEVS